MMLDSYRRSLRYHNENGLILDPQAENKDAMLRVQYWSLADIETFKERYLAHPKNFGYIANALDNKVCVYIISSSQCYGRIAFFRCLWHLVVPEPLHFVCRPPPLPLCASVHPFMRLAVSIVCIDAFSLHLIS